MCVCLSAREHISGTAGPIVTKFVVLIHCVRGSDFPWRRCDMLRTSGFMDDVTFGRNGPYGDAWLAALRYRGGVWCLWMPCFEAENECYWYELQTLSSLSTILKGSMIGTVKPFDSAALNLAILHLKSFTPSEIQYRIMCKDCYCRFITIISKYREGIDIGMVITVGKFYSINRILLGQSWRYI